MTTIDGDLKRLYSRLGNYFEGSSLDKGKILKEGVYFNGKKYTTQN